MAEKTFLSESGVTVTNSRFLVSGQTYAMSGVTSVRNLQDDPSKKGAIILGIVGLLAFAGGKGGIVLGLLLIAGAVAWFNSLKSTHTVVLSSASGEARALSSKDDAFIGRVVSALNEAIVERG